MDNLVGKSFYANMWEGILIVRGKLYFEEDGFGFRAFKALGSISKIQYKEIVSIQEQNTLVIIPNGIGINLRSGHKMVFAVNNRRLIMDFLNSMISHG